MEFNYIDLIIIGALGFFAYVGYLQGFIRVSLDIVTIVIAFFVALDTHAGLASVIERYGVPQDFSIVVAFFLAWVVAETLLYFLIQIFYPKIPKEYRDSKINRYLGILPSFLKGFAILAVFLLMFVSLPFPNQAKDKVTDSYLGSPIADRASFLEGYIQDIFKDVLKPVEIKITKPESDEFIELDYKVSSVTIDVESEKIMLELINKEREKEGLEPLTVNEGARDVARKHSKDMFSKGYFSHQSREGLSPFDRLEDGEVEYLAAGENLALAPDVYAAHEALMASPGHRENILTSEFKKAGIGIIDGGRYGKMFTQNFTD